MNTALNYMKFSTEALEICVSKGASKHGTWLYIYYSLNCNRFTGDTHSKTDAEIAKDLKCDRTTIMRARANLEDIGLILPTQANLNQKHTYKLPHIAKIDKQAESKAKDNKRKGRQIAYAREKQNIENVLSRRLTHPEIQNLKRKYELDV